jgi:uncharacterized protein YcfJ
MRRIAFWAALFLLPPAWFEPSHAAGCLKGAVVGGVVGHVVGHHSVAGAAAGCAIGHHEATKHAQEKATQQQPSSSSGKGQANSNHGD